MKNVSELYKEAISRDIIYSRITGELKTKAGSYSITDNSIVSGSLSISNKCVNKSNFEYGSAIAGEMKVSLLMPDIDRYSLYDSIITLTYFVMLSDGTEESVKLGTWTVSEPTKTKRMVALKCYDNMLLFDISIEESTFGTPYALLQFSCEKCGVELAQTEDEIKALPNGEENFSLRLDRIDTYRDFICYIAMVTATFATIDENGKLKLVPFGKNPVAAIKSRNVLSSTISDFETKFFGVHARFIAEENYAPYFVSDEEKDGLLLDMGDIPIVQGLPEFKHELLKTIKSDLDGIIYTPVSINMLSDVSIEIGDMVTIENANMTTDNINTIVTSISWIYHGKQTIKSVGSNPKLASVKDSTRKQLTNLESEISAKDIVTHTYTNASEYSISNTEKIIALMNYATITSSKPVFICTVQFTLDFDGIVEFGYYIDGIELEHTRITKYLDRGQHFLTFSQYFENKENERHTLSITACTSYTESEQRKQDAKIATIYNFMDAVKNKTEPLKWDVVPEDESIPTMKILEQNVKAVLFAQGLAGAAAWDGTITINESVPSATLKKSPMTVRTFSENIDISTISPEESVISESIKRATIGGRIKARKIKEETNFKKIVYGYNFSTQFDANYVYDRDCVMTEANEYKLLTVHRYTSEEEAIDSGRMCAVSMNLEKYESVESVVVENG